MVSRREGGVVVSRKPILKEKQNIPIKDVNMPKNVLALNSGITKIQFTETEQKPILRIGHFKRNSYIP